MNLVLTETDLVSQPIHEWLGEAAAKTVVLAPPSDDMSLRGFVAHGNWPAKFGQPAALWPLDGQPLHSSDGEIWYRLEPPSSTLDSWIGVLSGEGIAEVVASPAVADDPHAIPASG